MKRSSKINIDPEMDYVIMGNEVLEMLNAIADMDKKATAVAEFVHKKHKHIREWVKSIAQENEDMGE